MLKFLFGLVLLVHGLFALAVQHFAPSSWVVGLLVKKKLDRLNTWFPVGLYPHQPAKLSGYLLATFQVVAGFLIVKRLARL